MSHLYLFEKGSLALAGIKHEGVFTRFMIQDANDPSEMGRVYHAQVISRIGTARQFMLDLGDGKTGFLQLQPDEPLPTYGQSVEAVVVRDAEGGTKTLKLKLLRILDKAHHPGMITKPENGFLALARDEKVQNVTLSLGAYTRMFKDAGFEVEVMSSPQKHMDESGMSEVLEDISHKTFTSAQGWHLVIEILETLTFVDVNAGSCSLAPALLNESALGEIGRQIRLRNLSGLIVVDFLKTSKREGEILTQKLKGIFAEDSVKTDVLGLTRAGLMEIMRARKYPLIKTEAIREFLND